VARTTPSVGRNEPCPCGSGRKYKQCCLDKDEAKARKARAKEAEKARKAAEKAAKKSGKKPADSAGEKTTQPRPPKPQTYQPWKKSATNTHAFQRMTTPRKVGGS
jgi:hypothetical protein